MVAGSSHNPSLTSEVPSGHVAELPPPESPPPELSPPESPPSEPPLFEGASMLIVVLSSPEHAVSIIKKSAIKNDFIIGVLALRILTVVGKN
jgi:hypothetical protein